MVLAKENSALRTQSHSVEDPIPTRVLPPGTSVGRYVVEELIGAGGMGVVYRATDPELKRSVALKLLRGSAQSSDDRQARLAREAQLIAQVSHANVVQVYDVGVFENRVFIAMEFVEGQTAAEWSRETKRPWRETVRLFIQAGKGLDAAHEAGLVHRDFKPDNILIGPKGRVCVSDFGLARDASAQDQVSAVESLDDASPDQTATATILGTPAYMAPEQHEAAATDARADQFSFCVSFYELLYGHRPFPGSSLKELRNSVVAGEIEQAPAGGHVPKWLRPLLLRGLRADREERFESMRVLLAQLDRRSSARTFHWPWVALVLGLSVITTVAVMSIYSDDKAQQAMCSGGEREIGKVWNDEAREQLRSALTSHNLGYEKASSIEVLRELDERATEWATMRRSACEETRVRGTQSEQLLDLRMACLDAQRSELAELIVLLSGSGRDILETAVDAAHALTPVTLCADTSNLLAPEPLPADPEVRSEIAAVRKDLAAARAAIAVKSVEGLPERIEQAISRATKLNYKPVLAESQYVMARLRDVEGDYKAAEQHLRKAIRIADASGHDDVRARAWVLRIDIVGDSLGEPRRALELVELAEAAVDRSGADPQRRADFLNAKGVALARQGQDDQAIELLEEVVKLTSQVPGAPGLSKSLIHLAVTVSDTDLARALPLFERAIALDIAKYGDAHPNVALSLMGIASVHWRRDDGDAAFHSMQRAKTIYEASLRPMHPLLGSIYGNMALVLESLGREEEAIEHHQMAIEVLEQSLGPGHPNVANKRLNLGALLSNLGRTKEASQELRKAITIYEASLGTHRATAGAFSVLGQVFVDGSLYAEAIAPLERALALYDEPTITPTVEDLAEAQFFLARALAAEGQRQAYVKELIQKGLAICPGIEPREVKLCTSIRAF